MNQLMLGNLMGICMLLGWWHCLKEVCLEKVFLPLFSFGCVKDVKASGFCGEVTRRFEKNKQIVKGLCLFYGILNAFTWGLFLYVRLAKETIDAPYFEKYKNCPVNPDIIRKDYSFTLIRPIFLINFFWGYLIKEYFDQKEFYNKLKNTAGEINTKDWNYVSFNERIVIYDKSSGESSAKSVFMNVVKFMFLLVGSMVPVLVLDFPFDYSNLVQLVLIVLVCCLVPALSSFFSASFLKCFPVVMQQKSQVDEDVVTRKNK